MHDEIEKPHGGKRNGAGRPKGALSFNKRALIEAAESGGEMPIAYMLRVMRDENAPDLRRDAMAKAAAAHLYPKTARPSHDEKEEAAPQAETVPNHEIQ